MFKLAMLDGWNHIKNSMLKRENIVLLLIAIVLIAFLWKGSGDFPYIWIVLLSTVHSDYGKGRLLPDIFYMVPMNEKEKKRYILYRSFGLEYFLYAFALIIGWLVWVYVDQSDTWISLTIVVLWWLVICLKKQFYDVHKQIIGSLYPGNMTSGGKRIFWTLRIVDYIVIVFMPFCYGIVTTDSGMHIFGIYMGLFIMLYIAVSLAFFVWYVKSCMDTLKLSDMF